MRVLSYIILLFLSLPRCTFTTMSIVYLFVSVLLLYVTYVGICRKIANIHVYQKPTLYKASCILYSYTVYI